jgi:hypothetical protein
MGDRVLLQVIKRNELPGYSPVIYCHWLGGMAVEAVKRLAVRMNERRGDVDYIAARLLQEVINGDDGDTGFGLMHADKVLTAEDSHGDAGIILVNADTFEMTFLGGYLSHGHGS